MSYTPTPVAGEEFRPTAFRNAARVWEHGRARGLNAKGGRKVMQYPLFTLSGQVALVTGAARGLGRAIALALAHAGADVALGLRDVQADAGLAAEITKMGRKALPLQMDMLKMDQIFRAVDETAKEFGRIDILV